jgi:hypothetical protein
MATSAELYQLSGVIEQFMVNPRRTVHARSHFHTGEHETVPWRSHGLVVWADFHEADMADQEAVNALATVERVASPFCALWHRRSDKRCALLHENRQPLLRTNKDFQRNKILIHDRIRQIFLPPGPDRG